MNKEEFDRRTRSIKIEAALVDLLESANIWSIQLGNAQYVFEANGIQGFTPDTIKRINEEHSVILNTLKDLVVLTDLLEGSEFDRVRYLIRDMFLDQEKGRLNLM